VDDEIRALGHCLSECELQLAGLVPAEGQPCTVVSLYQDARATQHVREARTLLQWRGLVSQLHSRQVADQFPELSRGDGLPFAHGSSI